MKEAEYDAWLEGLKPGDEVIVETYNYHWRDSWTDYTLATVTRLTKTLIIVEGKNRSVQPDRFYRRNGQCQGEGRSKLSPLTDEIREIWRVRRQVNKIRHMCNELIRDGGVDVKALPEEKRVNLLLALESVVPSLQAK